MLTLQGPMAHLRNYCRSSIKSIFTDSKRKRKAIGGAVLLILFLLPIFLFYQWATYYSINPLFMPESGTKYHMELSYPPIANGKVKELLLDAQFEIVSNKPIAEGVNMTLANPRIVLYGGTPENERIIHNISEVNIAFQNAQPMGETVEDFEHLWISNL
jgi:hypothetical protein